MPYVFSIYSLFMILGLHIAHSETCSNGEFLDKGKGCKRCPEHCLFCDSIEYCLSCENEYWGAKCEKKCSNCKSGTSCEKTNGFCLDACSNGLSGVLCDTKCAEKCLSCNRTNSNHCLTCAHNMFTSSCDSICPSSCSNETCEDDTGFCTFSCNVGFWGTKCEEKCSVYCDNKLCLRENGTCIDGSLEKGGVPSYAFYVPTIVIVFCLIVAITGGGIWCIRRKRRDQDSLGSIQPEFKNLLQGESDKPNEEATSNTTTKLHARDQNTKASHDNETPVKAKSVSCNNEPVAVQSEVPGGDQRKADRTKMKQQNKDSQSSKEKIGQSSMPLTESVTHTKQIAGPSEVGGDQRNLDRKNMEQTITDQNDVEKKTSELLTPIKADSVSSETKLESEKTKVHGDQRNTERNKKTQPNKDLQCVEQHFSNPSITGVSSYTEPVVDQNKVPDVQRKADRNMTKQPNENPQSVEKKISKPLGLMNLIVSKIKPSKDDRVELKSWQQKLKDIANHLETKDEGDIRKEFSNLPSRDTKHFCEESQDSKNKKKLEEMNICPYDFNRVSVIGHSGTYYYMNASYIKKNRNNDAAFIACIAPVNEYYGWDFLFWRMVWLQRCPVIVMLNKLEETNIKLPQYWPNKNNPVKYSFLWVTCTEEYAYDRQGYVLRTFEIKGETTGPVVVKQLQYLGWSERKAAGNVQNLLEFRNIVNEAKQTNSGPIVVHSRKGVGRTGTYIALDILLQTVDGMDDFVDESAVDIFSCVKHLREQRVIMVETEEQYKFLHHAVAYYLHSKAENERGRNADKLPSETHKHYK